MTDNDRNIDRNYSVAHNKNRSLFTAIAIILVILSIYFLLLRTFYSFLFINTPYNIFEIGGTLPGQPLIYLNNSFLSNWIIYSNYGSQGTGLLYSFFYFLILSAFRSISIAERAWFFIEFGMSSISSFVLFRKFSKSTLLSFLFSLSFSFSPVVANMTISGAYMIYMLYAFTPLLILLTLKIFDSSVILSIEYSIVFAILSALIFEFNPGYILWVPVFLIVYFTLITIFITRNILRFISNIISLMVLFLIFILLTRTLSTVFSVFGGHTVSYFSSTAFGASSVNQILIDLETNFNGWLSFNYWYPAIFLEILIFSVAFIQFKFKLLTAINLIAIICLGIQLGIILISWAIFHFYIISAMYFIARYFPFLGEYIPHFGYVIIVAYIIIQCSIIIGVSFSYKPYQIRLENRKIFKESITKAKLIFISILIFATSFAIPINFHTNYPSDSSSFGMYTTSNAFLENNSVPNNVQVISNWFMKNTNTGLGYRVLFFPYSMSTDNVLLSDMKWTYSTNLTNQAYPFLYPFTHNNTQALASIMADSAVEYIVVYFGPFLGIDNSYFYQGSSRFYSSGYSWELSWEPAGSPSAWAKIFNNSAFFSIAGNAGNAIIYKNNLYRGSVLSYDLGNITNNYFQAKNINTLYYNTVSMDLLIKTNSVYDLNDWITYNSPNNISITRVNGTEALNASPIDDSVSYKSAYQYINLVPNEYYLLSYKMTGTNISGSWFIISFYQKNGTQVSSFDSNQEPATVWYGNGHVAAHNTALFKTPSNYSYIKVTALVQYNQSNSNNNSFTLFSDINITDIISVKPEVVDYNFESPWNIIEKQKFVGRYMIRFLTSYNPGWTLIIGNITCSSENFNSGFREENAFWIDLNYTLTKGSLYFVPQNSYIVSMHFWEFEWAFFIALIPAIDFSRRARGKSF